MSKPNLPISRSNKVVPAAQGRYIFALGAATAILSIFLLVAIRGALSGDLIIAFSGFFGFALALWSLGSLYITVPLSLRFIRSYYGSRDYAGIDRAHTQALRLLNILPFRRRIDIAVTMSNLALARLCQGYYDSAESLYEQAEKYIAKNKRLSQSLSAVVIYHNLSVVNARQRKFVEAELHATRALEIAQLPKMQGPNKMVATAPLAAIGYIRYKLGEYESALQMYQDALAIYQTSTPPPFLTRQAFEQGHAACYLGLCVVSIKLNQQAESEQWCDKFLEIVSSQPHLLTTMALDYLNDIANEYMNRQLFDRAQKLLDIAYAIGHDFPFHPDAKQTLNYYEKLLLLTGRQNEVADMRSWLRSVDHSPAQIESHES